MANILGSILSSFKKDDEDELKVQQPKPLTSNPAGGGGLFNTIKKTASNISTGVSNTAQNVGDFWNRGVNNVKQSFKDDPSQYNLFSQMAKGNLKTNTPLDKGLVPTQKVMGGAVNFVADLPRAVVTRPVGQSIVSVADAAGAKTPQGVKIDSLPIEDSFGKVLFGTDELKSYQRQTKDAQEFLEEAGLPKNYAQNIGLAAGVVNAGLDLPGGGLAKKPVKEGGEKVIKELVEKEGKELVEQTIRSADELAPLLKDVLPKVKGNLDEAVDAIKSAGIDISDDVISKLKSGKVVEGEGFVFQFQKNADKFIANFDKGLRAIAPETTEKAGKEAVESTAKEGAEELAKKADDVTKEAKETLEELGDTTTKETTEAVESTVDSAGSKPPGSGQADDTAEALTKEQEFGKEVSERKGFAALDDEAKARVEEIASDPKFVERMERIKGKPLTEDEVREAAVEVQDLATQVFTKEQTKEQIARELNLANKINELMADGSDDALDEAAPLLERWLSQGTDLGRRLQARQYAGDPGAVTGDEFLKTIFQNVEGNKAEILKEYKNIDRTNPQQFREFFFKHVEPRFADVVDEYRYVNILSSPKTQIRNVNANLIDSAITEPGTKVMRGFVDSAKSAWSKIRGVDRPRENFSREAIEYYKGYFGSLRKATEEATAVLKGQKFVGNPDLRSFQIGKYSQPVLQQQLEGIKLPSRIAEPVSKTLAAGLEKGGVVNQALEAGDIFFTTLIKNGEEAAQLYRQSRGVDLTKEAIEKEAKRVAADVALRTEIGEGGQGLVNDKFIDGIAQTISQLRNSNQPVINATANAVFPFVRTTANYTKRFLDYTPGAGLLNLAGRSDVDELVARQLWGSTLMMGTLWYAFRQGAGDNMTWDAPSGEKERELFYASGRKPYSVKIGNQWVSYQQLGMIGAPLALTASIKNQIEQGKDVSESQIQSVARAYGEMLPYFGDMSFARSFGNLSDALTGDGDALQKLLNEPFRQAVPLAGMTGWAKSILDPIYRKSESKSGSVILNAFAPTLKNIPGLSALYEAYTDPLGQESRIDKPLLNAFSPINISKDNPVFSFVFELDRLEKQENKLERDFKEGKIDAGGVERGVNQLLENAVSTFGGNRGDAPGVQLPGSVDPRTKVPEEEKEKINVTDEQMQELINKIPSIKEQMLANILGQDYSSLAGGSTTSRSSGGVSLKSGKVGSPPSQKLSSASGINISSVLDTPEKTPTQVAGITLPQTTSLQQSLPTQNITAEELLRRARVRSKRLA